MSSGASSRRRPSLRRPLRPGRRRRPRSARCASAKAVVGPGRSAISDCRSGGSGSRPARARSPRRRGAAARCPGVVSQLAADADQAPGGDECARGAPSPVPWWMMRSTRALRFARSWVIAPRCSSGTSIDESFHRLATHAVDRPVRTSGLPTVSSKPSRRIDLDEDRRGRARRDLAPRRCRHARSAGGGSRRCRSPRPRGGLRSWRAVSFEPSWPASGEELMPIVIERLGSSTWRSGQRRPGLGIGEGLADGDLVDAGDGDELAGPGSRRRHPVEPVGTSSSVTSVPARSCRRSCTTQTRSGRA